MPNTDAERIAGLAALALHESLCADDDCDGSDMGSYEQDAAHVAAVLVEAGVGVVAEAERERDTPDLPFTLRMPTNREGNADGQALNSGTQHVDVQVILDPGMEVRGECRHGYYGGPVIALREWNEQVFLHELLHAATGWCQPPLDSTHPPHGHEIISRVEVALWETGWRFCRRSARADAFVDGYERAVSTLLAAETALAAEKAQHYALRERVRALVDGMDCEWGEGRECDGPTCCRRAAVRALLDEEADQ